MTATAACHPGPRPWLLIRSRAGKSEFVARYRSENDARLALEGIVNKQVYQVMPDDLLLGDF